MWRYNILGDNNVSISRVLRIDPVHAGYILLNVKLISLKRGNYDPILTVKRTEWRKFIDYYGRSIESDPSRVTKKIIYIFHIEYIQRPSYVNIHI